MRALGLVLTLAGAAWCRGPLPVAFEPNRGQEPAGADFVARGPGYRVSLSAGRAELTAGESRIVAILAGSRLQARGEAEDRLPGVANYIMGFGAARAIEGIPTYARVRYRGVYPGVDLVYYGNEGRLEFDFIVAPGADPRRIRLRFAGARGIRIDSVGDLVVETAGGTLRQRRPAVYQEIAGARRPVAGRYALRGDTARFELADYDRRHPLVIDPALAWATYFGSTAADTAEAVAVDSSGNTYIAGATLQASGLHAVYVSKLNPGGTQALFTTTLGGTSDDDMPHAIAVDSGGNAWIAGESSSSDYYGNVYTDAFLAKYDPNGKGLFAFTFGGSYSQIAYGLALDASANAYVVGATNSPDFQVNAGQKSYAGGVDGFVARFDSNGNEQYASYLGGGNDDYALGVAVGASGNVYMTGSTDSSNFPVTLSGYQRFIGGGTDAFATKFSPTLSMIYSTFLGGSGDDSGNAIAVDTNGGAHIAGQTKSSDFPAVNAFQKTLNGASDMFVTKMSADGASLVYSTPMGGGGDDSAYAIALDGAGNAYITGSTTSTDFPVSDAFQKTNSGTQNAVVAALSASGAPLFASYLGGNGSGGKGGDAGNGIAFGCAAGLVVAGNTASTNFPATAGAVKTTYGGGDSDGFVANIAAGGMPAIAAGGVVNGANYAAGPVAPGSLVVIYGSGMAAGPQLASAIPLPAALVGTSVTIDGAAAPLFYASSGQMNVQLPYEATPGTATVTVTNACGTSASATVEVAQAAPYIFQLASGDAIAYNQDNTLNGPDNPATAASVITVFLTGIGPVDHPVATGAAAAGSPLSQTTLPKSATIGDSSAGVYFLGLTPSTAGVAQANLVVPGLSAGTYRVVVTVGGVASNGANVYVK